MKKRLKYLGVLGLLPFMVNSQQGLTNSGATIVVEQGARLVVEGGINNTTGTITNDGTIEVQGNFINDGTLDSDGPNSDIIFNGTAAQTFDANGASVRKVTIDNSGADVTLTATGLTVTTLLEFASGAGNLDIADQNLALGADAAVTRGVNDGYIVADGTGKVVKDYSTVGSYEFPIGGDEFSPVTVDAGTDADGTVEVNVEETAIPMGERPAEVNAFLDRVWNIDLVNYPGGAEASVTATYDETEDVNGTEGLIKGASLDGAMMWSYKDAAGDENANTISGTVPTSSMFTGTNAFRRQAIKVFLEGPYATGSMSNGLNTSNVIPLTSPYDGTTTTQSVLDANSSAVVDWVTVSLRTPADGSTENAVYSKLLLQDGSIINADGSTTPTFRDAPESAFIAINHRNHLGVMTASSFTLGSASLLDFSLPTTLTFGTDAQKNISGVNSMFAGEIDGNDGAILINDVTFSISQFNQLGYILGDTSFDGAVLIDDVTRIISNFNKLQQY